MRTDAERFAFLQEHRLSVTVTNDGVSIYWRGKDEAGKPGGFYSIASGPTLAAAVDAAMLRWERKHRQRYSRTGQGVSWLPLRGWVS